MIPASPYMPNEYLTLGHVSAKTDAYAFGILLIECLTPLPSKKARKLVETRQERAIGDGVDGGLGDALQVDPCVRAVVRSVGGFVVW